MKILLLSILLNATTGAPVAMHIEDKPRASYDSFQECGDVAQAKGVVNAHDNIATEYVCRKFSDSGEAVPEVKVGPDDSPWNQWLQKQIERQAEKSS